MPCKLYAFLKAIRGNWRNAIYVSCNCATCPYGYSPACKGFLLTANEDGCPLVMSEQDFMTLSNESVEPSECWGTISREAFESLYMMFLQWHLEDTGSCPIRILGKQITGCNQQ